MSRAPAGFVLALVLSLSLSASLARPARAQDAATPLDPSESACVGQNIGSPCDSSATTSGGSCLAGCCCHFVTDPEGTSICAPCLACSDTSFKDPAYSPGACPDGGSLAGEDSGTAPPLMDAAGPPPVGTPSPSPMSSSGCSASGGDATSSSALTGLGVLLALALALRASRRPRAR
jgi:hypothetical protein